MQSLSKEKFEEEYTLWISSAAKDIAFTLNQLKPDEIKSIISRSEQYLEKPESVFGTDGRRAFYKSASSIIFYRCSFDDLL